MSAQYSVIPNFYLYGERPRPVSERFLHLEPLDDRCRPSHWNIRPHAHADLAHVFLIEVGRGQMRAETQAIGLEAPCLLLIPAGAVHSFAYQPETRGLVLTVARAYLAELARRENSFAGLFRAVQCLPLVAPDSVRDSMLCLAHELTWQAPGQAAAIESHLLAILVAAVRASRQCDSAAAIHEAPVRLLVQRYREALEASGRTRQHVRDYAAELGVSAARLRRACQVVLGCSASRLIQERLLIEAKRALLYSSLSIAETAYRLGFEDPAYFSRFFSKRELLSPQAYRRRAAASELLPIPPAPDPEQLRCRY